MGARRYREAEDLATRLLEARPGEPELLLLDEPLSALDAQIRRNMVEEIAKLKKDIKDLEKRVMKNER